MLIADMPHICVQVDQIASLWGSISIDKYAMPAIMHVQRIALMLCLATAEELSVIRESCVSH